MDPGEVSVQQGGSTEIQADVLSYAADGYSPSGVQGPTNWYDQQERSEHHVSNGGSASSSKTEGHRDLRKQRSSMRRNPSKQLLAPEEREALRAAAALETDGEQQQGSRSVHVLSPRPPDIIILPPHPPEEPPPDQRPAGRGTGPRSRRSSIQIIRDLFTGGARPEDQPADSSQYTGSETMTQRRLSKAQSGTFATFTECDEHGRRISQLDRDPGLVRRSIDMVSGVFKRNSPWDEGGEGRESQGQVALPSQPSAAQRSGKSRRASFLNMIGIGHNEEGGEGGTAGPNWDAVSQSGAQRSAKSRRSSFIDFFRKESGGLSGSLDKDKSHKGMRSRRGSMDMASGVSQSGKSRRGSMIDMFNASSKRALALLTGKEYQGSDEEEEEEEEEAPLWFTSMDDFKPINFMYYRGRYMSAFFACSIRTGEHFILKKYERETMLMSDERAVRRALAFGESLHHENLTKIMGTWEAEDALYIVEEYASKGDVQQDSMSHPERYTEAYMAVHVVKPLLNVLVYLHGQRILHRALYPENIMFGRDDKLRIGHYTSLVDLKLDSPTDRCDFLDYMAPEMLAMKDDEERMKALVSPTGEGVGGGGPAAGRARRRRTAAQNAATGDVQDAMMRLATGDDNAASGLLSMPTSQSLAASPAVLQRGATGNMQGDGNDEVDKSLFRRITKSFTTLLGRNDADDDDGKPAERTLSVMSTSLLSPRGGAGSIKVDSSRPNTVTSPEPVGRPSNPGGPGGGGVLGMLGRKLAGATVVPADRTIIVPHNPWEWQDSYDEKVDIWQVGCLVHEVMCGVLPFETEDKLLAAALILWADIQVFPDNLSPQCVSFIQACLTKDPRQRPSAESLLQHEWITRHEAGETLLTQAEIAAQNPNAGKTNADGSAVKRGGLLGVWDSVSSVLPAWMGGRPSAVAPGVGPTQPTAMSAKAYQRRGVSAAAGHLADNAYVGGAPAATSAVPPVARLEGASGALDAQGLVQREASVASAGDRALAGAARFPSRKKAVEEIQAEQQNRGEAKPNWQMLF